MDANKNNRTRTEGRIKCSYPWTPKENHKKYRITQKLSLEKQEPTKGDQIKAAEDYGKKQGSALAGRQFSFAWLTHSDESD